MIAVVMLSTVNGVSLLRICARSLKNLMFFQMSTNTKLSVQQVKAWKLIRKIGTFLLPIKTERV